MRPVFPEFTLYPNLKEASWLTSSSLLVSYENLAAREEGKEVYYILQIRGGEGGIKSSSGSYLKET